MEKCSCIDSSCDGGQRICESKLNKLGEQVDLCQCLEASECDQDKGDCEPESIPPQLQAETDE